MRVHIARGVTLAIALCAVVGAAPATATSASSGGRLAGLTQITYGCPGPQRVGQQCERWSTFTHARFALTRNQSDGTPRPSTRRIVISDGNGRFGLLLAVGSYTVTPLAQAHTHGGEAFVAHVRAGQVTRIRVRFLGYPMML
jgi:hypothetical protein